MLAIVSGLLTGARTPFSGRIQIVGKSPLTGTWADSNSGGSVASQLRRAGFDALLVTGRASEPVVLVVRDGEVRFDPAGVLWGLEVPPVFDALRARYGGKSEVGVSAIGPAGEQQARIASVMNDRYHAFGRQGFGAIYGSKNLKAIVVAGSGEVPIAAPERFRDLCQAVTSEYKKALSWRMRLMVWMTKPKRWMAASCVASGVAGSKPQGATQASEIPSSASRRKSATCRAAMSKPWTSKSARARVPAASRQRFNSPSSWLRVSKSVLADTQPSPSLAARCSAGLECPPMMIGTGRLGTGSIFMGPKS